MQREHQLTLGQRLVVLWRLGDFHCEKDLATGQTRTFKRNQHIESGHEAWLRWQEERTKRKRPSQKPGR